MRYWINAISRDHTRLGMAVGFTQAGHGRSTGLKRLAKGDAIVFYSPRTALKGGEPLQRFTALGVVADDVPYQAETPPDFHPWHRRLDFLPLRRGTDPAALGDPSFIQDKQRWGYPF